MNKRVLPLDGELAADVQAKRAWVLGHYERDAEASYSSVEGKLALLDTILSNGWVAPSETVAAGPWRDIWGCLGSGARSEVGGNRR